MQVLQIIFFSLGIFAICLYLYKTLSKNVPTQTKPTSITEVLPGYPADRFYLGPVPTLEERRKNIEWFIQFFKEFPESGLKYDYPQQANVAKALVILDKLHLQLKGGEITQEQYEIEYGKASQLIDISEDIV